MPESMLPKNTFFDINKLPHTPGVIILGISMSRIGNAQSPQKCLEYIEYLRSKIEYTEGIALEVWYGDYLYFHSDAPAYELRNRFMEQMISHKNAFMKLLKKDRKWTLKAFSFKTFGQVLLENSDGYGRVYQQVKRLLQEDACFQKYVTEDCLLAKHSAGDQEKDFILEEITVFYLLQKGLFHLNNAFVTDAEKTWTLLAYPGKPLKSEVYLFQQNTFGCSNPKNRYENCSYDLEAKTLYDYARMDIDTFDFSS